MGQILLSKIIPIEVAFLEMYGAMQGIRYIGYCSLHSFFSVGNGFDSMRDVVDEVWLIGLAAGMVFLVLGIMPVRNEK